jgi:hypothetical protein
MAFLEKVDLIGKLNRPQLDMPVWGYSTLRPTKEVGYRTGKPRIGGIEKHGRRVRSSKTAARVAFQGRPAPE